MDSKQAEHVIAKVREKQSQAAGSQHSPMVGGGGSSYPDITKYKYLPRTIGKPGDPVSGGTTSPYHYEAQPGGLKSLLQHGTPSARDAARSVGGKPSRGSGFGGRFGMGDRSGGPKSNMGIFSVPGWWKNKLPSGYVQPGAEKRSLDRGRVFGPASGSFADAANALSRVPVSDVAQGAGAGLFGAGLKPFLHELATRDVAFNINPKGGKISPTVNSKSTLQAFMNVMKKQKPRLGKGALIGGGLAAALSALLGKEASEKQGMSVVEGMQEQLQKQLRSSAMRDILGTALLGAGVAGTARGGQGLWNLINRSSNKLRSRSGIAPLPVPYRPTFEDEEEEKEKDAFDMPKPKPTQKGGLWWYMPAMLGAGAAGAYGGWKVIDKILDHRRRKEIEDEVEESRQDFQTALTSQYKKGSDSELGTALDELYSKMQKRADWFSPDTKGKALGMYASYAIPSALLGYMVVKGLADKGSTSKILEKAQRRRALKQQKARPAELYAVPTPIEEEEE